MAAILSQLQCVNRILVILDYCMVGADNSVSLIDQVVQFAALFVKRFLHFWYNRSPKKNLQGHGQGQTWHLVTFEA